MRTAIILAAVLVAVPAHAKPWQCVLWPKTCLPEAVPVPTPRPAAKQMRVKPKWPARKHHAKKV